MALPDDGTTPAPAAPDAPTPTSAAAASHGAGDPLPPMGEPIAAGLYRHYKGGRYEVLGLVRHSETLEVMVLYRALYGEHGLWVRPRAMFEGQLEIDGQRVARFARMDTPTAVSQEESGPHGRA